MVDKLKEQMMADYPLNLSKGDLINAVFHYKQVLEHSATQGSVDVLKEQVKNVDRRVSELKESTDKRFDAVDKRIDELKESTEKRFDKLEASVDARFNDVDKRFDKMDKKFDKVIWLFVTTLVALAAKVLFPDFLT